MIRKAIEKHNAYGKDKPEALQSQYHMNCAEVLIRAGNEAYGLDLSEEIIKTMQAFGGGFYSGSTCGALIGSLAVISHLYAQDRPSDQAVLKEAAELMVTEFQKDFEALDCTDIKARFRDPATGCNPVKLMAGDVLERVVKQMDEKA